MYDMACILRLASITCLTTVFAPVWAQSAFTGNPPKPKPAFARQTDAPKRIQRSVVWVSVSDTGMGINPEDMGKLFQEFSQVDSSASRQQQGTGLGLALSKKFVELHGGVIGAESIPGVGSSFWFILPAEGPMRRALPWNPTG